MYRPNRIGPYPFFIRDSSNPYPPTLTTEVTTYQRVATEFPVRPFFYGTTAQPEIVSGTRRLNFQAPNLLAADNQLALSAGWISTQSGAQHDLARQHAVYCTITSHLEDMTGLGVVGYVGDLDPTDLPVNSDPQKSMTNVMAVAPAIYANALASFNFSFLEFNDVEAATRPCCFAVQIINLTGQNFIFLGHVTIVHQCYLRDIDVYDPTR